MNSLHRMEKGVPSGSRSDAPIEPTNIPSSELAYRRDVDGLRAVAVLAVLGFHAAPDWVPGGFCGVDVFFVISGFLISSIIIGDLRNDSFRIRNFYARRIRRIFPALVLVLILTAALAWLVLLPDEYSYLGLHTVQGAAFILNIELYKALHWYFGAISTPLIHLWSLGVEEQFYLLWPVLLVVLWKFSKNCLPLFLIATIVISFISSISSIDKDPLASFYLPTNRLWELGLGGLFAYFARTLPSNLELGATHWRSRVLRLCGANVRSWLGAALLLISMFGLKGNLAFPGWWALIPVTGTLLLISAGSESFLNRSILGCRAMVLIGLISYPLYLWHWPLLSLSATVWPFNDGLLIPLAAVALAFPLAFTTYQYFEIPIRKRPATYRLIIPLCAACLSCAAIGYLIYRQDIPSRPTTNVRSFLDGTPKDLPPLRARQWDTMQDFLKLGSGSRNVLFVGDSNLFQYYSRIEQILLDHPDNPRGAIIAGRGGCPLFIIAMNQDESDPCRSYMMKALRKAHEGSIDTVVIGAAWYLYLTDWVPAGEARFGNYAPLIENVDPILSWLENTMKELVADGKTVYVILQTPIGVNFDPRRIIQRKIVPPGFEIRLSSRSLAEMRHVVADINLRLAKIAERSHANVIDPLEDLCTASTCPSVSPEGIPIYLDHNHISPTYMRSNIRYLDDTLLRSADPPLRNGSAGSPSTL